ncbi:MAG: hypothetical protein NT007_18150 [Candidatus Kapabacteria bacterium]|nr:hypothetical protein [Candidatus Kapabacteria bacterium]
MADLTVRRNCTMSDAELCMFTSNLCITMTRNLTDFTSSALFVDVPVYPSLIYKL